MLECVCISILLFFVGIGLIFFIIDGSGLWQSITKQGLIIPENPICTNGWKGREAQTKEEIELQGIFNKNYKPSFWISLLTCLNRLFSVLLLPLTLYLIFNIKDKIIILGLKANFIGWFGLIFVFLVYVVFLLVLNKKAKKRKDKMKEDFFRDYCIKFGKNFNF